MIHGAHPTGLQHVPPWNYFPWKEMTVGKFKIKAPEKTVRLCLDGSLQADWEAAEKALADARTAVARDARLTGNADVEKAAQAVRDIEERMAGSVLTFRLRAMRRVDWADLLVKHPPVEGDAVDKAFGANREGFFADAIPASIVEVTQDGEKVDFDVDGDWPDLADSMTDHQFNQFTQAVFSLNRSEVDVPFSAAASRTIRRSGQSSN